MKRSPLSIVIFGLSITSSWGNGHATTYRSLLRGLSARGHDLCFLERNVPWYAENRDLPYPRHGRFELYENLEELKDRFTREVREADLVIVGSYVPQGIAIGEWVTDTARGATAFYDIDTPVTLAKLKRGEIEYLSKALIPRYHLYLSFTGGPILNVLEREYRSPMARPLYCSVDLDLYYPEEAAPKWSLGYMGTYSADRQHTLDQMIIEPARQWSEGAFVVAGSKYPKALSWPQNIERIEHLPPTKHRAFYNAQRFTLNVTRADMIVAGYSPSVRLFEAAACGTPVISDAWPGLETFFKPGEEILLSRSPEETLHYLRKIPEAERRAIGLRACGRVRAEHTAVQRAAELERYASEILDHRRLPETASSGRAAS
jgi:spore maturation protein CgeB